MGSMRVELALIQLKATSCCVVAFLFGISSFVMTAKDQPLSAERILSYMLDKDHG